MKRFFKRLRRWLSGATALRPAAEISADHQGEGDAARARGDWARAAAAYRAHVTERPGDFGIWVQLGHALKEAGDLSGADEAYASANRLNDTDADLLLSRGHLARMRGDLASAAGFYHMSFALDGNDHALRELHKSDLHQNLASRGLHSGGRMVGSLDHVSGTTLVGWAVDPDLPDQSAEVEVLLGDRVIATGVATEFRVDAEVARLSDVESGFRIDLAGLIDPRGSPRIGARLKRTGEPLMNSPIIAEPSREARAWVGRHAHMSEADTAELRRRIKSESRRGLLSIVMPVYETRADWLREALDSVVGQWAQGWELICVDDASPSAHVQQILGEYAARDARIRIVTLETNGGISRATNAGIDAARGDYIALMDHDDVLEPEAVFRLLDATRTGAELIYSDEIVTGEAIDAIEHFVARSAFSHDYYLSHPYFVHIVCVRRDVARKIGGFDESMAISADVDFVLRVIEQAETVAHIPAFLYRWRTHKSSTGHTRQDAVTDATVAALNAHLTRMAMPATAHPGVRFNTHRVEHPDDGGKTLIIIPTKDRIDLLKPCIDSLLKTTSRDDVDILVIDHESKEAATTRYLSRMAGKITVMKYAGVFNFSRMNNVAAREHGQSYRHLVFMNNDIEAIEPGWLESMRRLAGRASVGCVGATLLYDDRTVQHSGVIVGIGGSADHGHKFMPLEGGKGVRNLGYNCSLVATRDYSAVTAACLMVRSEVFFGVDGFDEDLVIGYNDTDLCLRIASLGYQVLNDPFAVLYHHESATRAQTDQVDHPADGGVFVRRWGGFLAAGDPFYSPLLSLKRDHQPGDFSNGAAPVRVRPVRPVLKPLAEGRPTKMGQPVAFHGASSARP